LDARELNQRTVKGILSRINTTKFISSVELKHAFRQIEMEESSRRYTACTQGGSLVLLAVGGDPGVRRR